MKDVCGTEKTDAGGFKPIEVSKRSYDPGYDLTKSMPDVNKAVLKQGYASYGKAIGEGRR
jgi:hypothetical protein